MLEVTKKMKAKFEKIQNFLFELIPEKWEEIYLYASVTKNPGAIDKGEMYFYYVPKSILKKKPVNVYEVPKKFNINESEYLKIVDQLYEIIKSLRLDFADTNQELWTNLTISIVNNRFKIEFFYDNLSEEEYANYVRHIIWRYKYLRLGGEIKEERQILEKYFDEIEHKKEKHEDYSSGIYLKNTNNTVGYDREIEERRNREQELIERAREQEERKNRKIEKKYKKQEEKRLQEEKKNKNQILK